MNITSTTKKTQNNYFDDYKFNFFKRIFYGVAMGVSDGIPGYSGGTTLSILSFFDKLIFKFKLIFNFHNGIKNWFKNILWLIPFLGAWIVSLLAFSYFGRFMSNNGFSVALIILFFSFSIFSIPLFHKSNKEEFLQFKTNKKYHWVSIFALCFGFLLIFGLGIGVYFNSGIAINSSSPVTQIAFSQQWLWICLSALLAGFCMLIPGISGSFALFLTNTYGDIYFVILQNIRENFTLLILVLVSILVGIFLSILFSSYFLKKNKKMFINFCGGMVCASPLAIILGMFGNQTYKTSFVDSFRNSDTQLGLIIVLFLLAILVSVALSFYIKNFQENYFDFKKGDLFVIVDMQNDFEYKKGNIKIKKFKRIAKTINYLLHTKDTQHLKVIASKDVHPIDHASFEKWGKHCVQNTWGSNITDLIDYKFDLVIEKGTHKNADDFSCFYINNKKNKILNDFLVENKIKRVFIVGVMSDVCVKKTFFDFEKNGYSSYCITNLISTNNIDFDSSLYWNKSNSFTYIK